MNMVFSMSFEAILIWLYLQKPSTKENTENWIVLSTNTPMWYNGRSFFRLALVKSRQSTHILNFPSFFSIGTMFATHCRYFDTSKNPASNYFLTSSLILRAMSGRVRLSFFLIGSHSSMSSNLCIMIFVSNPCVSWYDQKNTSKYSLRSSIIFLFSASCMVSPIFTPLFSSSVPILITSTTFWCSWMIFAPYFSSLVNSSRSSHSYSPSYSAWLFGKSKSYDTIATSLSMVSRVIMHVMIYAIFRKWTCTKIAIYFGKKIRKKMNSIECKLSFN